MKRLENIEKNQNNNNDNDNSNLSSERSELSSERSKSSKKTSISDNDESQTSSVYLEDNTEDFFGNYLYIFDLDLKKCFNYIGSKEKKYIDHNILSNEILLPSGDVPNFFNKYFGSYDFCISMLVKYTSFNDIKSQQINFLKDLMNVFGVYKDISKLKKKPAYKAKDLYLRLLGNPSSNIDDILFIKSEDKHDREIYTQAKILFDLREQIFKKLVNKGIIKNDSDQSDIKKYEKSIAERIILRRQRFNEIANEEQNINKELFKKYFNFQMPTSMLKTLYNLNDKNKNNQLVYKIKDELTDFKEENENISKEEKEIENIDRIIDIVEKILEFNEQKQKQVGKGLKILTPNQMLSRLPIFLAQLKAGNNSEKLKNQIRQLLYSLCRLKKLTTNIYKSLIDII